MANEKISELTVKTYAQLVSPSTAPIPVVDNSDNFAIVVDELFANFTNDGAGAGVYKSKSGNAVTLRSIAAGSNKVTVTESTSTIDVDVTEANLTLNNVGGTLSLAKGGTGASLSDPGSDQLLFWDDSDSAIEFLTLDAATLSITGNNLAVKATGIDLDLCDNTNSLFLATGDTLRTSGTYVASPSDFEVGAAATEANTDGTHVIQVSINGVLYKLLAVLA